MSRVEVLEKLTEICRDVFDEDQLVITENTSAADVEGWDSLTNLSFINEIEEVYDIALSLDEINKCTIIKDYIDTIESHLKEQ